LIGVADADTEEVLVVGGGEGGDIGCEVAVSSDLAAGDFPIVEGEVRGGGGGGAEAADALDDVRADILEGESGGAADELAA
jgi:hypothetical protein